MPPTPLQPEVVAATANELGIVRVDPIPFRGGMLSSHSSWGLAGSLAVHVAAVAAFGGWAAGWTPGWIPPPAGLNSQAQSGKTFTSVASAPASEPDDLLRDAPPVKIEVAPAPPTSHSLSATDIAFNQPAAGRPVDLVLPDVAPAPPPGEERSLTHQIQPSAKGTEPSAATPTRSQMPVPQPRALASSRPKVSTQAATASAAASIGSRAQAGAQTNAAPRAVFSPEPIYPPQALAAGQTGKVVVRMRIDFAGQVVSARVQTTSGNPLLDEAALVAVRRWRFEPREGATSGAVDVAVPIRFDIERKP